MLQLRNSNPVVEKRPSLNHFSFTSLIQLKGRSAHVLLRNSMGKLENIVFCQRLVIFPSMGKLGKIFVRNLGSHAS